MEPAPYGEKAEQGKPLVAANKTKNEISPLSAFTALSSMMNNSTCLIFCKLNRLQSPRCPQL